MDTSKLKKFAQFARRTLIGQVGAKLDSVLAEGAAARREHPEAMKKLEAAIGRDGKSQVIERVAYIWFNRFSALRFMDVNDFNPVRVVSPLVGQFQPEILAEAKAGNIDEDRVPEKVRGQIRALLDGRTPSPDAQAEAYRLLLVAICNDWHKVMPFLFERIDDFTELLLPEDLLSNASILAYTREAMTPDVCQDVEVIGWLYQFYISEKKDEVFAGLKKSVKISAENIPAATQLFTPHWIVRYLVENSLGRLWMLNRPNSRLRERMDYYIAPVEPETDFLRLSSPEEIKVCDPACGSGHMLTYAFDLLHAIYEEEGYDSVEIPGLILANNLYGIEIDERAGALAAFALTMKAAARRKRFLRRSGKDGVQPNICVLENVSLKDDELADYVKEIGRELFTTDLRETLGQFEQAKNFGSLIVPNLKDADKLVRVIAEKQFENNLFLRDVHERVQVALRMAGYLSPKYHVVIANPPYMGRKNMNPSLQRYVVEKYKESSGDFFATFIERCLALKTASGFVSMISMDSWMFGDDYTGFRGQVLSRFEIECLIHLGPHAFDEIKGEVVQVAAFVLRDRGQDKIVGTFVDLTRQPNSGSKEAAFLAGEGRYYVDSAEFDDLPRNVFAYFISEHTRSAFKNGIPLREIAEAFTGLQTGDNPRFIRSWSEVSFNEIDFARRPNSEVEPRSSKWVPYVKGSEFRKWYGNHEFVLDWSNNGEQIKSHNSATVRNQQYYFRSGLAYNNISAKLSLRSVGYGHIFDQKNSMFFADVDADAKFAMAYLHSKTTPPFLRVVAPKDFGPGSMKLLPVMQNYGEFYSVTEIADAATAIARGDWDAYETSWDFARLPLLSPDDRSGTLESTYARLRAHWRGMAEEMQRLEEENNRIFIDAYGLQDELTPEVPLEEITLTCNPAYRYGGQKAAPELEALLLADTMREFVSYAVGCMFGRYSLDASGLVLANQGQGREDYRAKIPNPTFEPDADNVIPVLDGEWFVDDIAARFRRFLRVTFGEEFFQENLAFVEGALGKDIRKYLTRDFFNDHVKRYKKRPIYWLFSSPKGTFNALIYMHRYRSDTVSVVLNDYLREFRSKLEAYRRAQEALSISGDTSPAQKTKALKEIEATARQIEEIDAWERDVLFPLATQKIEIDLDDGVKANYPKLGAALKPIKGLNESDD
ncbi:BREX-1 system adenine-specific DNA-methyltransferase PglX [Xanthobacter autotrophicus DSM 431]|uniref:BREX-1 system adenine-specific DNA-methyltransferase PglX n=1 Tax=Xanthobacter nonsaccharivorans TaxID=3119912 RepID=UPI0037282914